ncbi:MAG: hypothetical protein ABI634_06350 [Acidobacteriota bacterium]
MSLNSLGMTLIVGTALTVATACAPATGRVYVRARPPAAVFEARAASPGPGFTWIGGFYRWTGRDYIWIPGHYERAPRPRAAWVPERWVHDRRGWYLVEGHWR